MTRPNHIDGFISTLALVLRGPQKATVSGAQRAGQQYRVRVLTGGRVAFGSKATRQRSACNGSVLVLFTKGNSSQPPTPQAMSKVCWTLVGRVFRWPSVKPARTPPSRGG